jgi:hypothetical protein
MFVSTTETNALVPLRQRAEDECKKGRELEFVVEHARAISRFEESLNLYARAMPILIDYHAPARCLFDLGVTLLNARRDAEADQAFTRAYILDSALQPDIRYQSPAVVGHVQKLRQQIEAKRRVALTVTGAPVGAEVWLDGGRKGVLPLSVTDLLLGEHWLYVLAPGRKFFATRIWVDDKSNHTEVFLTEAEAATDADRIASRLLVQAPTAADLAVVDVAVRNAGCARAAYLRHVANGFALRTYGAGGVSAWLAAKTLEEAGRLAEVERVGEQSATPTPAAGAPIIGAPRVVAVPDRSREVPWPLAALPLGAGQFAEHRPVAGALFCASEVLLLAGNVLAYQVALTDRVGPGVYRNAGTVEALKWVINVSAVALILEVIGGGADGIVHRRFSANGN